MKYFILFAEYIIKLLPSFVKGNNQINWIKSLFAPLQSLNSDFLDYIQDIRYEVSFTGQVMYLEHILNDVYDPLSRSISIIDGQLSFPPFMFNRLENRSIFLYNNVEGELLYLRNQSEFYRQFDFIVIIPFSILQQQEIQMRALINKYRHAGMRFDIRPLTPQIWAQATLDSYLILNEHVDSQGNDLPDRALSATKKQYIYDTCMNVLWPKFGAVGATVVSRRPAQMAAAFYLFTAQAQMTKRNSWSNTVDLLWVMESTVIDRDGPPDYSGNGVFNILCVSKSAVGQEWDEITQYSFRRSPGAGRFKDTILPVLKGKNVLKVDFFNSGFTGKIPNCFPSATVLPGLGQGGLEGFSFNSSGSGEFDNIDLELVRRYCKNNLGINIYGCSLAQNELEAVIDVCFLNLPYSGAVHDFRQNSGSAAASMTKFSEIMSISASGNTVLI